MPLNRITPYFSVPISFVSVWQVKYQIVKKPGKRQIFISDNSSSSTIIIYEGREKFLTIQPKASV